MPKFKLTDGQGGSLALFEEMFIFDTKEEAYDSATKHQTYILKYGGGIIWYVVWQADGFGMEWYPIDMFYIPTGKEAPVIMVADKIERRVSYHRDLEEEYNELYGDDEDDEH